MFCYHLHYLLYLNFFVFFLFFGGIFQLHMHDQLMLQFYLADLMGVRTWGELAGVECKGRERENTLVLPAQSL